MSNRDTLRQIDDVRSSLELVLGSLGDALRHLAELTRSLEADGQQDAKSAHRGLVKRVREIDVRLQTIEQRMAHDEDGK